MKILVTGGAGFIGSHLCDRLLKAGHNVVCADDLSLGRLANILHNLENPRFRFEKIDVTDVKKLSALFARNRFNCVFHLAANSDIQSGGKDISVDYGRTFMTTFRVIEQMRKYNVKEIIFASTSAVYGELAGKLSENAGPLNPVSFYGAAKLASEGYISAACENYGIKARIIRFPNVIGSRSTHGVIYDFVRKLKKNPQKLEVLGDGKQFKPYLHVSDLIEAMLLVWRKSPGRFNCYNVAASSRSRVSYIAQQAVRMLGSVGAKIVYAGGDRGWVGDVPQFNYSLAKISRLGWNPSMTSDEAVSKAVRECASGSLQ